MTQADLLTSPDFLEELLDILRTQGLLPSSLRLIGLLGFGNNATVFAVMIDGVHHILKIYASKSRMRRELRHLRKITPPDRLLFSWEEQVEGLTVNLFIVEMPLGRQMLASDITASRTQALSEQLIELHRVRFKQRVSVTLLKKRLLRAQIALTQIDSLGLDAAPFEQVFSELLHLLENHSETFHIEKSRIHGDLWWPNIVATDTEAYLIDWDAVSRADAAEDLAKLRCHLWFPRNAFPSRNFFWTKPNQGESIKTLFSRLIEDHEAEFNDDLMTRLRFYLPLYCFEDLAALARGKSIVEHELRPKLYRLEAQDLMQLFADPTAPTVSLEGSAYYDYARRH